MDEELKRLKAENERLTALVAQFTEATRGLLRIPDADDLELRPRYEGHVIASFPDYARHDHVIDDTPELYAHLKEVEAKNGKAICGCRCCH
jgi:hypothetical protein